MKLPTKEKCLEWVEEDTDWSMTFIHGNEAQLQSLIHRAYKEGAEAMREEALEICSKRACLWQVEDTIRNLKVEDV